MELTLDGPQTMLAATAADLMAKSTPVERFRALRDSGDELAFTPELWAEMVDLGWTAIPFAESVDGLGMGLSEIVLLTEAMGRALAPEPLISGVVLAGGLLAELGAEDTAARWLASTISGEKRYAVAIDEPGSRYDFSQVALAATSNADGFVLDGRKVHVLDGWGVDGFVVAARTSGEAGSNDGITLFLADTSSDGLTVTREHRVDRRNAATVDLERVELPAEARLGPLGGGLGALQRAVDRATVALAGEMLGIMAESFERTLQYLNERQQFGQRIGSFQALQHRAAKLFIEIELARSTVMAAARALDSGCENADRYVSAAKARCSDAVIQVTNEALQMHGGIGMTDEHDIGLFLKRARVTELTFGDSAFHRDRFAALSGF